MAERESTRWEREIESRGWGKRVGNGRGSGSGRVREREKYESVCERERVGGDRRGERERE